MMPIVASDIGTRRFAGGMVRIVLLTAVPESRSALDSKIMAADSSAGDQSTRTMSELD